MMGFGVPISWVAIGGAVLLSAAGVQTWRIERLHGDLREAREQTKSANALTKAGEEARDREAQTAKTSFEGLQTTCTALGAAGIQKGRVIERIVSAPPPVAGKPRGLVGAGELRGIMGQDGPARTP